MASSLTHTRRMGHGPWIKELALSMTLLACLWQHRLEEIYLPHRRETRR